MSDASTRSGVVAVRPIGGLGNRLQVISSFRLLARHTGRAFYVCWGPSVGFSDEDLTDLFENEFERVTEAEFERLGAGALCLHEAVAISGIGPERRWRWAPGADIAEVLDAAARRVVTYEGKRRLESLVGPDAAARLPDSFPVDTLAELRTWRPVEPIRRVVDELVGSFNPNTVGVHVRRGDAVAHPRLGHQFRQSSDGAFFARMDQLVGERPDTRFFLATDSADTEARFRGRYADALLANPSKRFVRSVWNESKENQRDAVIDLFTLARTGRILGTSYSSFSQTAADLGDTPLEIVLDRSVVFRARRKLSRWLGRLRERNELIVGRSGRGDPRSGEIDDPVDD